MSVASNPEFLREGAAIARLQASRPDRGRRRGRARAQEVLREIYRPLVPQPRADPDHRPAHRRAHQICRQCLPRGQDQLHQRDRRPVRSGRRRRPGRRARHRPRQPHRARSSCTPGPAMAAAASRRIRWRCCRRPTKPGSTSGSSAPTVEVNDDRKAAMVDRVVAALGGNVRASASACSGSRSSPTPTTCARRRRSRSSRGWSSAARRSVRSIRSRASRPSGRSTAIEFADDAYGCGRGRRRAGDRDRVG